MSIEVREIHKQFGTFKALDRVSIHFPTGQLVGLLGPSGSGKTTLLRIIAGLERADTGQVLLDGADASRRSAQERRVGFVFQHYALFRHMSVFENVAFGLRVKPRDVRPSEAEIQHRVHELLKLVQLDWTGDRLPSQLSGGQRQRIALARALAVEPKVLLLDEPFGALDAKVRKELRRWLRRLHDEIHVTSLFVTHDVDEALEVADQVVIMNEGRVEQTGTPDEVYEKPANPFVFQFLGNVNLFHNRIEQTGPVYTRPHEIDVSRERREDRDLEAELVESSGIGPIVRLEFRRLDSGEAVEVELPREQARQLGARVGERLFLRPRQVTVFTPDYEI